ncbi:MAG: NAD-dependent epimerase/dehydratase family protein [Gemmatimonas sp.]
MPTSLLSWIRNTHSSSLPAAEVVITGAAGRVSTMIRGELRDRFATVRLTDRVQLPAVAPLAANETFAQCELSKDAEVMNVMQDARSIVHLGAYATDGSMGVLAPSNIHGVANMLEAAAVHNVRRVVLVSSMHVLGLYRRDEPVSASSEPRPDSLYGLTKLHAEQMAHFYHRTRGLSVVVLRPGHITTDPTDAEPCNWTSASDFARLIALALTAEGIGYEVWHAMTSADAADPTHTELARRFGFDFSPRPACDAQATEALMRWYPDDETARTYRGGVFASGRAR